MFKITGDQPPESRNIHAEFKDKLANNYNYLISHSRTTHCGKLWDGLMDIVTRLITKGGFMYCGIMAAAGVHLLKNGTTGWGDTTRRLQEP